MAPIADDLAPIAEMDPVAMLRSRHSAPGEMVARDATGKGAGPPPGSCGTAAVGLAAPDLTLVLGGTGSEMYDTDTRGAMGYRSGTPRYMAARSTNAAT